MTQSMARHEMIKIVTIVLHAMSVNSCPCELKHACQDSNKMLDGKLYEVQRKVRPYFVQDV